MTWNSKYVIVYNFIIKHKGTIYFIGFHDLTIAIVTNVLDEQPFQQFENE